MSTEKDVSSGSGGRRADDNVGTIIKASEGFSTIAKALGIIVAMFLSFATVVQYPKRLEKVEHDSARIEERLTNIEQKQNFSLCVTIAQIEKTDWSACKFFMPDLSNLSPTKQVK